MSMQVCWYRKTLKEKEYEREREREIICPEIKIIIAKLLSMWQSVLTKFLKLN